VLVEEFNRILISRVSLAGYRRGIEIFEEKEDLLPFEEAKLYGHNAIHALIGYLAALRGMTLMSEASSDRFIMDTARKAFIEETGAALIKRNATLGDRLFTASGFGEYAEDLLDRMVRPTLNDLVVRICRDPARKLAYDDRIIGAMRLALEYGITPRNLATGAAAAVFSLLGHRRPAAAVIRDTLLGLWPGISPADAEPLTGLICEQASTLR
jgi:mannitol-1-phosphate 5-dehydrogenase